MRVRLAELSDVVAYPFDRPSVDDVLELIASYPLQQIAGVAMGDGSVGQLHESENRIESRRAVDSTAIGIPGGSAIMILAVITYVKICP